MLRIWCVVLLGVAALMAEDVIAEDATANTGPGQGNTWEWSVTPYIWFADTSFELRARDQDIAAGDIDFGEIADKLDGAFQIMAEVGREHWSGFVDFTYLSISDTRPVNLVGLDLLEISTESDQLFVDAAVAYWPWPDVSGFNMYLGVRHTDMKGEVAINLADPMTRLGQINTDRSYTDALIGFRDRFKIIENWALIIRMDYGFGDSDGVFLAQGVLRWAVGRERRHGLVIGYRYKDAKFEPANREERYKYKGPVLGFNFRF